MPYCIFVQRQLTVLVITLELHVRWKFSRPKSLIWTHPDLGHGDMEQEYGRPWTTVKWLWVGPNGGHGSMDHSKMAMGSGSMAGMEGYRNHSKWQWFQVQWPWQWKAWITAKARVSGQWLAWKAWITAKNGNGFSSNAWQEGWITVSQSMVMPT